MSADEMNCQDLVELVTAYFEGTLPHAERQRFEDHLAACPGCRTYVGQMRRTVWALGALPEESIPPDARDALLQAFRGWRATGRS